MASPDQTPSTDLERRQLLRQIDGMLELPMIVLGFAWLLILIVELTAGLSPLWERVSTLIWVIFVFDFLLRFTLAPAKLAFLKTHWLGAASLVLPALRIFRITRLVRVFRMARAVRVLRFARILTGVNRGLRSFRGTMRQRGVGYVLGLTVLVALAGGAGMFAFEQEAAKGGGFESYASALWWTVMLLSTMGSEYWPRTTSGRALCLLLSLYGLAIFGYITAALASYFVGRDAKQKAHTSPRQP